MKGPVRDPATFSFNAAARTVTFAAPIPAQQAYILGILNITRNVFIYLPVKPGSGGSYDPSTGVLTLALDTTAHANGDALQVIFDDTQSGATATLQVAGNTALSSIDAKTAGVRTPTTTSVASSASSVTLLAANTNRRGLDIFNNSTATLWVSYTTPAVIPGTSAFAIDPGGSLTRDAQLIGTGALYGIWTSANGTAQVTEWV